MNKLPGWSREFFIKLFNREYRLGYTNRKQYGHFEQTLYVS